MAKIEFEVCTTTRELALIEASEQSAIKLANRGYDRLLCNHVYLRFCPDCPQYRCGKRDV